MHTLPTASCSPENLHDLGQEKNIFYLFLFPSKASDWVEHLLGGEEKPATSLLLMLGVCSFFGHLTWVYWVMGLTNLIAETNVWDLRGLASYFSGLTEKDASQLSPNLQRSLSHTIYWAYTGWGGGSLNTTWARQESVSAWQRRKDWALQQCLNYPRHEGCTSKRPPSSGDTIQKGKALILMSSTWSCNGHGVGAQHGSLRGQGHAPVLGTGGI